MTLDLTKFYISIDSDHNFKFNDRDYLADGYAPRTLSDVKLNFKNNVEGTDEEKKAAWREFVSTYRKVGEVELFQGLQLPDRVFKPTRMRNVQEYKWVMETAGADGIMTPEELGQGLVQSNPYRTSTYDFEFLQPIVKYSANASSPSFYFLFEKQAVAGKKEDASGHTVRSWRYEAVFTDTASVMWYLDGAGEPHFVTQPQYFSAADSDSRIPKIELDEVAGFIDSKQNAAVLKARQVRDDWSSVEKVVTVALSALDLAADQIQDMSISHLQDNHYLLYVDKNDGTRVTFFCDEDGSLNEVPADFKTAGKYYGFFKLGDQEYIANSEGKVRFYPSMTDASTMIKAQKYDIGTPTGWYFAVELLSSGKSPKQALYYQGDNQLVMQADDFDFSFSIDPIWNGGIIMPETFEKDGQAMPNQHRLHVAPKPGMVKVTLGGQTELYALDYQRAARLKFK